MPLLDLPDFEASMGYEFACIFCLLNSPQLTLEFAAKVITDNTKTGKESTLLKFEESVAIRKCAFDQVFPLKFKTKMGLVTN